MSPCPFDRRASHRSRHQGRRKNVEVCIHIFVKTRGEEACGIAFWCCDDPTCVELSRSSQAAAQALGLQLHAVQASSDRDFDAVFDRLIQLRAGALVIGPDNLFTIHKEQLAKLTVRHAMPAVYQYREFAAAGGLMSYGTSETEYYLLVGTYAGRVLKGDKPADLPVQQSTKVELFLNLKTAKALGITVPLPLSGRADEMIE